MSADNTVTAADRLAAKREAVLRPRGNRKRLILPLVTAVLVLGVAAGLVARILPADDAPPAQGEMFTYIAREGVVSHDLAGFQDGAARFYQHKAEGGVIVRYFVHRGADGTVTAALDSCAACWREARGHRQEGTAVACAACGKRFEIAALAGGGDPCMPIPLTAAVDGDAVTVPIPELLEAAKYFQKPYGSL